MHLAHNEESGTLYVGDLSFFVSEQALADFFGQCGVQTVAIKIGKGRSNDNLQYAFVQVPIGTTAMTLHSMHERKFMGRKLRVSVAGSKLSNDQSYRDGWIQIYISFTSSDQTRPQVTEESLDQLFSRFGAVADVSIKQYTMQLNPPKQNGYGFVYFFHVESAVQAVDYFKVCEVDGVHYNCQLSHRTRTQLGDISGGIHRDHRPSAGAASGNVISRLPPSMQIDTSSLNPSPMYPPSPTTSFGSYHSTSSFLSTSSYNSANSYVSSGSYHSTAGTGTPPYPPLPPMVAAWSPVLCSDASQGGGGISYGQQPFVLLQPRPEYGHVMHNQPQYMYSGQPLMVLPPPNNQFSQVGIGFQQPVMPQYFPQQQQYQQPQQQSQHQQQQQSQHQQQQPQQYSRPPTCKYPGSQENRQSLPPRVPSYGGPQGYLPRGSSSPILNHNKRNLADNDWYRRRDEAPPRARSQGIFESTSRGGGREGNFLHPRRFAQVDHSQTPRRSSNKNINIENVSNTEPQLPFQQQQQSLSLVTSSPPSNATENATENSTINS